MKWYANGNTGRETIKKSDNTCYRYCRIVESKETKYLLSGSGIISRGLCSRGFFYFSDDRLLPASTLCFFVFFCTAYQRCLVFFVPLLELHHSGSLIKQTKLYTTKQVLKVKHTLETEDTANRVSGLCAFVQPIEGFLSVNLNGSRYSKRIVSS